MNPPPRTENLDSKSSSLRFITAAFEGPLDLLLHLIRANEVDIYDIPIAEITAQYLAYMQIIEELDLTVAGEYLVMAATLIEIKSRMLLPLPPPFEGAEEAEDPRAELVSRLLEYQQYQGTVETFREWEELRRSIFFRTQSPSVDDYILPVPEGEVSVAQLIGALHRVLAESGADDRTVTSVVPRRRVTLRLKMAEIGRRITTAGEHGIVFDDLFELPCSRYDIVISFLAMLELLRSGRVRFTQTRPLDPIMLFAAQAHSQDNS